MKSGEEKIEKTITPELIEKWRIALKDLEVRERRRQELILHHKKGLISPDLEILAKIYEGEVSLEFQEKMIEELEIGSRVKEMF